MFLAGCPSVPSSCLTPYQVECLNPTCKSVSCLRTQYWLLRYGLRLLLIPGNFLTSSFILRLINFAESLKAALESSVIVYWALSTLLVNSIPSLVILVTDFGIAI